MEPVIENKSPIRELEEVRENVSVNKKQCLESNGELKCPDEVEQNNKDEMSIVQQESNQKNEDVENNCETALNSGSGAEIEKDILCTALKDIVEGNNDDYKNSEEKSNDDSNLNKYSENPTIEEIEDNKNERSTAELESNDLSILNQDPKQTDTGNATDGNQASVQNPDQASSSSTQIHFREKCKYGSQCYRLNAEHKATFSHPGDTDYDEPDNRPECPYGVLCYRKNPQHKLDYKHTQTKRKRTQNPVGTATLDGLSDFEDSMEESVDESEYDDSFIDDDELDDDDEFDSDLEFDDMDEEIKDDENSDDEDGKKKKRKKKNNGTKEQKKKKSKND